jgi:hypothetical protein
MESVRGGYGSHPEGDMASRHARRDRWKRGNVAYLSREQAIPVRHATDIVMFAHVWVPYGGAPAEEIFERFGMTTRRFIEALWACVHDAGVGPNLQHVLASVYPRP